jgi:hypothetical protein
MKTLMAATLTGSLFMLLPTSIEAEELSHYDRVQVYVNARSIAGAAQAVCPGVKGNVTILMALMAMAEMSKEENEMIEERLRRAVSGIAQAVTDMGRLDWCAKTWRLFGENGEVMKGLIYRDKQGK